MKHKKIHYLLESEIVEAFKVMNEFSTLEGYHNKLAEVLLETIYKKRKDNYINEP